MAKMKRTFINELLYEYVGPVLVQGLAAVVREQKDISFVVLQDQTGQVQVVVPNWLGAITPGSFISVYGDLVNNPKVKLNGYEVIAKSIQNFPRELPLPINEEASLTKQLDWRHISLRTPHNQAIFNIQNELLTIFRENLTEERFTEIHTPKLMDSASESGAELFEVNYFDGKAYLAQSPQFYKQMAMASGFDRVFEIAPAFRADPSFTTRHLTEFISIDVEMSFIESHHDLMDFQEKLISQSLFKLELNNGLLKEIFKVQFPDLRLKWPRIPFSQVKEMYPLIKDDINANTSSQLYEKFYKETGSEFFFVTDYPASGKPFYHKRDKHGLTKSYDLFWKGIEISSGAQRETDYATLIKQIEEKKLKAEPLNNYLNFFRYGCPPHGGFGMGLARIMKIMLDLESVQEAVLLPRTPNRLSP